MKNVKILTLCAVLCGILPLIASNCQQESSCSKIDNLDEAAVVNCLNLGPKENILLIPEVKEYLEKHKVYISLTTSPLRISKMLPVLQTLDLEFIENILLVLPEMFSRGDTYTIPDEIRNFKKLKILRIAKDLGPITKLLPAVVYVNNDLVNQKEDIQFVGEQPLLNPDPDAIVITIDDDVGYYRGAISQLIKTTILKNAAVSGKGLDLEAFFSIQRTSGWPEKTEPLPKCGTEELSACDIVEGWAGISYKARYVNVGQMKQFSEQSKACFRSDDLVLNFSLAGSHVPRFWIINQYILEPISLIHSHGRDALHNGAGDSSKGHLENYSICFADILRIPY